MAVAEAIGYALIAFGVPIALFITTIVHDPLKIIIMAFSAFFWLIALAVSSLLWFAVVPLREQLMFSVPFAVVFQEMSRYALYRLFRRAQNSFKQLTEPNQTLSAGITIEGTMFRNVTLFSYVAGLGYGSIYVAIAMANVVADLSGPGSTNLQYGNYVFPLNSAATSLIFCLLQICWTIIFFDACEKRSITKVLFVVVSHLLASGLTLLNSTSILQAPVVYLATTLPCGFILLASVCVIVRFVLDYDTLRRNLRVAIQPPS